MKYRLVKEVFVPRTAPARQRPIFSPGQALSADAPAETAVPACDPDNPYTRFYSRGRSFAELLPRKKHPAP